MQQGERVNLPRLIMSQFRWLDQIINSRQVTEKMLEILCVVPLETQREVIACIPEVVDDAEHNDVAKELRFDFFESKNHTDHEMVLFIQCFS